jgi:hypothetical protein
MVWVRVWANELGIETLQRRRLSTLRPSLRRTRSRSNDTKLAPTGTSEAGRDLRGSIILRVCAYLLNAP